MKKIFKIFIMISIIMTLCTSCASLFFGAVAESRSSQNTQK